MYSSFYGVKRGVLKTVSHVLTSYPSGVQPLFVNKRQKFRVKRTKEESVSSTTVDKESGWTVNLLIFLSI